MVNTMFVLDRTLNTSHILSANKNSQSAFWEDTYTQEFDTGAESFEFSCYTHESIKEGNYVAFFYNNQYKMFQIIEVQEIHKKGRLVSECYCEIASLQLLNNYVKPFSGDMNCIQFFQHILHGTEWHIGKYSTSLENVVYTVNEKNIESVWSLIEDYKDIYGCEINVRVTYDNGHVTGQYIDIYAEGGLGSSTLKRFEYGINVTGITKTKDLYDWCTGVILDVDCDVSNTVIEERDGYGFTKGAGDVILDDNANRMYNAGRTHVIGVYQGKETEPVEACINAWKELQKRKEPKFDYKVTTALKDEEYEDIHLGDTVYVVDHSYTPPLLLEARVGKLELSFTDRTQNSCTLTNYKEIKSKLLDADYIKLTGTITDVVNAFFPITSEGIADGAIVDGKIETTYFQQITADIVSAGIGAFENLYAQGMTVINADIENLKATSADITDLKAQVAEIDTLINGHLTSDNIQSLILTADKVTVEDAFIKDAMIDTISAGKINTGVINTNNVQIQSEDGSMLLQGNLQQFKDKDGKVRIQIGKDANGDFTFALFSQDGVGILIDEDGIKEGAIGDGLIVDDMVADNANIQGGKLDINSVITSINNGTTTINSNRIYLDEEGQSLQVAFEQLKTKVETIEDVTVDGDLSSVIEQVTSNTTNINIMQGEISNLIANTTITKENGEVVQLKDEYNSTKDTVDSHTTKIGSLETTVNSVSSKQASMELDLDGFRTEVSNSYATKSEVESLKSTTNFIKNGKFKGVTPKSYDMPAEWTSWGCEKRIFGTPYLEDGVVRIEIREEDVGGGIYQNVTGLPKNSTFTLSFKYHVEQNVQKPYCDICFLNNSGVKVGDSLAYYLDVAEADDDTAKWKVITFTTPNVDFTKVRIGFGTNYGLKAGSNYSYLNFSVGLVQLELGTTQTPYKDYEDDVKGINYNLLNNGKFENCYVETKDIVPSWICDYPSLYVRIPSEESYCGCLELLNNATTTKAVKQRVVLELEKTYTISFKSSWQRNVNGGVQACIEYYDNDDILLASLTIPVANKEFDLQTFTFQTPALDYYSYSEVKFIMGDNVGSGGSYTTTRIGEVKLEEGDYYTGWRGSKREEGVILKGENLIKNGDFSSYNLANNTITDWIIGGNGVIWHQNQQGAYNKPGCIYFAHPTPNDEYSGFYQPVYNLKKRTEYTLTFYISWEFNVREFYVDLVMVDRNGNNIVNSEHPVDLKPGKGGTYSYTFVTPGDDFYMMNVGFCHRGALNDSNGGMLGIAGNVELTEKIYMDSTSPLEYITQQFVTKTEFNQTNEDFTFRIAQSGGGNLIKNSRFKNDKKYWHYLSFGSNVKNTNWWIAGPWGEWNNNKYGALTCYAEVNNIGGALAVGLDTEWIEVQPNTAYSFSCYLQCHRSKEVAIEVWYDNGGTNTYLTGETLYSIGIGSQWGQNYWNWTRYETTFTTPNTNRIWLRFYMGNHTGEEMANAYLWLSQPVLVEGYTPSKVWVPHESELYDGIVKIDDSGLTVQQGNNKSVLDSEALNFYAGDVRYSRVRGGVFEFTNSDGSPIGILGKNTWVGTNTGISSVNAVYGHSVSLGAQYGSGENFTSPLTVCSKDGKLSSSGGHYFQGLNLSSPKVSGTIVVRGNTDDTIDRKLQGMMIYANYSDGYRTGYIFGNEEVNIGTQYGYENWTGLMIKENGANNGKNELHAYGHLDMHNYNISRAGWVNPVSATTTYTTRLLNEGSIENMTYGGTTFTEGELRYVHRQTCHTVEEWDYVEGVWSPLGVYYCYCELPIFMAENIELDYHVNIGKVSWGDYRVIEKNPYLFIVESQEEGFAFTWEVVAKQIEVAKNNTVVANNYVNTGRSQVMPTEDGDFTYELDKEEFIEEEVINNTQENINTGEE